MKLTREDKIKIIFPFSQSTLSKSSHNIDNIFKYINEKNKSLYHALSILILDNYFHHNDFYEEETDYSDSIVLNNFFYHSSLCSITFSLLQLLEKHHIDLRNDPNLEDIYHQMPESINTLIDMLSSSPTNELCYEHPPYECRCNYYYSYSSGIYPLSDDLEYLEYKLMLMGIDIYMNRPLLLEKQSSSLYDYDERDKYRLYNLNFINSDGDSHNVSLMIDELKYWSRYFHEKCKCRYMKRQLNITNPDVLNVFHNKDKHECCYCITNHTTSTSSTSSTSPRPIVCKYITTVLDILSSLPVNIPHDCSPLITSYL